jgi:hypothetical protein
MCLETRETSNVILVSHRDMRLRWSLILPIVGLILFTAVTIRSAKFNAHDESHPRKYFWWSSLRLDTDPLNRHPVPAQPCSDGGQNCAEWMLRAQWVTPSIVDRVLAISGLPAFFVGALIVAVCSNLGIDEVLAFMVSMPVLLFCWYYFVGWLIDRWLYKRKQSKAVQFKVT